MRNISFSMTTPQVRARTKTVTCRIGWEKLKAGDRLCAIEKGQGLKKGETVARLGVIEVVSVRREQLRLLTDDLDYGFEETEREGFPPPDAKNFPSEFVRFFCIRHHCTPDDQVTRIEFRYVD